MNQSTNSTCAASARFRQLTEAELGSVSGGVFGEYEPIEAGIRGNIVVGLVTNLIYDGLKWVWNTPIPAVSSNLPTNMSNTGYNSVNGMDHESDTYHNSH